MTLHEMAKSTLKMARIAAKEHNIDAKNIRIKSIQFTRCGEDGADIFEQDGEWFADIYFRQ